MNLQKYIDLQKEEKDINSQKNIKLEKLTQMRVLDMHAHLSCLSDETGKIRNAQEKLDLAKEELELRRLRGTATFLSGGTIEEWQFLQQFRERDELLFSFGVHPWYADQYREPFGSCDAVGEIGMDSVWCSVPLTIQQKSFEKQLQIAADLHKPVILHTKGQERRIAEIIRDFPEKICVHWYSGDMETLEQFIGKDCYFTLGPDVAGQRGEGCELGLYGKMLRKIPADRLFVETDGISAVAWARGADKLALSEIPEVLSQSMACVAAAKGMTEETLSRRMMQNLAQFLR